MSDIWNNIVDGASDAVEWVGDTAESIGGGIADATEAVSDFFNPQGETGTFTSAPPEGNKYYAPVHWDGLENKPSDIRTKIDDLHDPLVDMFQREHGTAYWPDYAELISMSQEMARDADFTYSSYGGTSVDELVEFDKKPSEILPYYVPEDATDAEQQAIDDQARADAASTVDQLHTAFFAVIDDGSLTDLDTMLQEFSGALVVLDDLILSHEASGFARLTALSESWVGDDSDTFTDKFGARLRPGIGMQREIGCGLLAAAVGECGAKLTAMEQLGNALDEVHNNIDALMTGSGTELKLVAKFAFNRIPFAGDVLTGLDAVVEVSGDESTKDDVVSSEVNKLLQELEYKYDMGLTPQQGSSLLRELLATAESATVDLKDTRDILKSNLEISLGTWKGLYATDPQVLVPGESE